MEQKLEERAFWCLEP